jgi:hypothetical protein
MMKTASMAEIKLWAMIDKTIMLEMRDCLDVELAGGISVVFNAPTGSAVIRVGNPEISKKSADFYFAQHHGVKWEILAKLSVNPDHGRDTCFGDQFIYDPISRTLIVSEPYFNDGVVHAFDVSENMAEVVEFDTIVCDLEESDKPEGYKKNTKFPLSLSVVGCANGAPAGSFTFEAMSEFANGVQMDRYYREPGANCIMMEGTFDSESTNNHESEEAD